MSTDTDTHTTAALRDALLAALRTLPGTRAFHLHVLLSSPTRHTGLFPYAHPRPRVYAQDLLLLLSEARPDAPRQLVAALEAAVYTVPGTGCALLYVSKVDSTGQGGAPGPTRTLVRALLAFYVDPRTRPLPVRTLWVQLFARAQGQYLFPNSAEYEGKRPLSDVRLCAWWRGVLGEVARDVQGARLWWVLPGYSELEAGNALHVAPGEGGWVYGHPYAQTELPLPCPPSGGVPNLGHFIPSFEDDPKARFLDEIAHTTEGDVVKSPERKRPKTSSKPRSHAKEQDRDAGAHEEESKEFKPTGELQKVSADEFWERMSFRQECVSGAVTGFFALGISTAPPTAASSAKPASASGAKPASSAAPPQPAPQPGQVAQTLVRRVVSNLTTMHEFSSPERAARATETLEASIRGLCEGIPERARSPAATTAPLLFSDAHATTLTAEAAGPQEEAPRTPPRKKGVPLPDVTPNPFPEPIASLETYYAHIYGSVSVDNAPLAPKAAGANAGAADGGGTAPAVTVLTVRKKKRKMAE